MSKIRKRYNVLRERYRVQQLGAVRSQNWRKRRECALRAGEALLALNAHERKHGLVH